MQTVWLGLQYYLQTAASKTGEEFWAQFPESVVSLRGSLNPSYDHRTVFRPFPESVISNERRENLRS